MTVIERERVVTVTETVTERERAARDLEAAALEIEVRGHAKFALMTKDGRVCAVGAYGAANGWDGQKYGCGKYLGGLYGPLGFSPNVSLALFNNAPERTAEEVTFAFRWRAQEIRDGR
jgi:hypothetical protein